MQTTLTDDTIDRLYYEPPPEGSPDGERTKFMLVTQDDRQRYSFSVLWRREDGPLNEFDLRRILNDLSNMQRMLEHKEGKTFDAGNVWAKTGPDEWTEFDPTDLRLLTRTADAKGWCASEDRYI